MISVMWKWNPGIISRFFREDIHIICGYTRGYRIKEQKISEKEVVYFQPEDNHETIAESQKLKKFRFKHELKSTFLFNFLR